MKRRAVSTASRVRNRTRPQAAPASVLLGRAVGPGDGGFRVLVGGRERVVAVHESVDPALLAEAARTGAMVVIDGAASPAQIVGTLQTRRAIAIEPDGAVRASVRALDLAVAERAVVRSQKAFVAVEGDEVELFGQRLLLKAHDVLRALGRLVKIN